MTGQAAQRSRSPFDMLRRGRTVPKAVVNAWQATKDDVEARRERDRLAPSRAGEPGNGLELIDVDECWNLLPTVSVGRIGITAHSGQPVILPVNYSVVDRRIFIRSGRGPKLEAARREDLVAFEVDQIDVEHHTGWSVTITGRARWIRDASELAAHTLVMPETWAAGPREDLIAIDPVHIGGRRLLASHGPDA
jgi:nitroimidazol reductase NimA-like FMN-containing flavoprotein (pyridoxamine 5'-phosphate oxidase superfamily)